MIRSPAPDELAAGCNPGIRTRACPQEARGYCEIDAVMIRYLFTMKKILNQIQVHIPFDQLYEKYLPFIAERGINPEIGFSGAVLDRYPERVFLETAAFVRDAGVSVTLHAPFMDLRPGAVDPRIRQVTVERLKQVFDLAVHFRPKTIVCHPAFDERYYVSSEDCWLENSLLTWSGLLDAAEESGAVISLENVYETDPLQIKALLDRLDPRRVCFCLDTGHYNAFSKKAIDEWLLVLGKRMGQVHLHDNDGTKDQHLPVGHGTFPFARLFAWIRDNGIEPIITVEPHTEEHLWKTLDNLINMGLVDGTSKGEGE
ncbi:MAG: sugar phosphate isomerase/epimerase [Syntrophales bacterium]|nr:sugar phosphate isomerase/epimerase [Syntrophales bacterium]MDD5231778.1 sugar phosphate isomerase/epimerase [Syntrophales bacterium]